MKLCNFKTKRNKPSEPESCHVISQHLHASSACCNRAMGCSTPASTTGQWKYFAMVFMCCFFFSTTGVSAILPNIVCLCFLPPSRSSPTLFSWLVTLFQLFSLFCLQFYLLLLRLLLFSPVPSGFTVFFTGPSGQFVHPASFIESLSELLFMFLQDNPHILGTHVCIRLPLHCPWHVQQNQDQHREKRDMSLLSNACASADLRRAYQWLLERYLASLSLSFGTCLL